MEELIESPYGRDLSVKNRASLLRHTGEIRTLINSINNYGIRIGQLLIQVRQILPHGDFHAWAEAEFGWSSRKTRLLMQVARHPKSVIFADLPVDQSAWYLLTAESAPIDAMDEAIERASDGERISPVIAKEIISEHDNSWSDFSNGGNLFDKAQKVELNQETYPIPDGYCHRVPPIINALLEEGFIGRMVADEIGHQLREVEERVFGVVSQFGISDPELIPILNRLCQQGSLIFDDIELSGCIEVNGEDIRLPLATYRDLLRSFDESNYERSVTASQARKRQRFNDLKKKLDEIGRGQGPELIVTESLEDISSGDEDALAVLVPGPISPISICNRLESSGYKILTLIAYRGNPLVNNGDQIIQANQARHYLLKPIQQLMEVLSNVSSDVIDTEEGDG